MVTTEQIKELTGRREGLRRHLAIEDKLIEFDEEQARTLAPDFWDRPEEAEKQLRKVADELGISQSYISRLEKRIIKRLRGEISAKM